MPDGSRVLARRLRAPLRAIPDHQPGHYRLGRRAYWQLGVGSERAAGRCTRWRAVGVFCGFLGVRAELGCVVMIDSHSSVRRPGIPRAAKQARYHREARRLLCYVERRKEQ
jgi:hypothetical protein